MEVSFTPGGLCKPGNLKALLYIMYFIFINSFVIFEEFMKNRKYQPTNERAFFYIKSYKNIQIEKMKKALLSPIRHFL